MAKIEGEKMSRVVESCQACWLAWQLNTNYIFFQGLLSQRIREQSAGVWMFRGREKHCDPKHKTLRHRRHPSPKRNTLFSWPLRWLLGEWLLWGVWRVQGEEKHLGKWRGGLFHPQRAESRARLPQGAAPPSACLPLPLLGPNCWKAEPR